MAIMERAGAITSIRRIAIVVSDLDAAQSFFADAFDFELVERRREDAGLATLLGVPGAQVRQTIMRLGEQEIGLLAFDPPGRAVVLIVGDLDAGHQRLGTVGAASGLASSQQSRDVQPGPRH